MNNEFLKRLETLLSKVPESDRREMLYDYEEHFQIGLANGKSVEELTAELGDPYVIARDLLADYRVGKDEVVQQTEEQVQEQVQPFQEQIQPEQQPQPSQQEVNSKELTMDEKAELAALKAALYKPAPIPTPMGTSEPTRSTSGRSAFGSFMVGMSLLLFNLIFIVGPAAGIFAAYISICAVALVFTLSPLVLISSSFLGFSHESLAVNFFVSLALTSLGMLMGIGMMYVGKYLFKGLAGYTKLNVRMVRGGRAA
ncbi:DUF1700 domain-containing protein [Bacillus sp. 31A1R]|uniref:DUF1700 domain-containing protein n=1 Tax=Robertmurraya mangrovi TaxID=3098077 RepID=A0ABU5J3W5_9BACI|nr:DUF1700 domain-containing protein [Bacillus sp. 31A1R]MDZ5474031.1 DUF1700 domain-containing protein [Bacillus sp. 31A1R]